MRGTMFYLSWRLLMNSFYSEEELKKLITPHSENPKIHPFDIDAMFQERLDTFKRLFANLKRKGKRKIPCLK